MWPALTIIGGLLATLLLTFLLWAQLSKSGKGMRALVRLPVTPVTKLTEGERAKLVGRVVLGAGEPLLALVSRRPVAAYQGYLSFWSPGLAQRHIALRESTAFVLESDDGRIVIQASQASFALSTGQTRRVQWADAAPWMDDLVARDGLQLDPSVPKSERVGHYEMAEGVIAPGMRVAVVGVAAREITGDLVLRPDPSVGMPLTLDPDIVGASTRPTDRPA